MCCQQVCRRLWTCVNLARYCAVVAHDQGHPEPKRPHRVIAERIKQLRAGRLTGAQLAEKMTQAGIRWDRSVVANLESGRRSAVSVEELLALAFVLDVAPIHLIVPTDPDGWYAVTPDIATSNEQARAWIRGAPGGALPGTDERKYYSEVPEDEWKRAAKQQAESLQILDRAGVISRGHSGESPADQPVIAAIVTSRKGVLVGRRQDGTPPWTFIAGWSEPGESPADTIIREVKEETGCSVKVGKRLGERVHPDTGRRMIYYAAKPTHGTAIHVGDEAELAEVRWVSMAEADELLPRMFGPVREYLARELGGQQ